MYCHMVEMFKQKLQIRENMWCQRSRAKSPWNMGNSQFCPFLKLKQLRPFIKCILPKLQIEDLIFKTWLVNILSINNEETNSLVFETIWAFGFGIGIGGTSVRQLAWEFVFRNHDRKALATATKLVPLVIDLCLGVRELGWEYVFRNHDRKALAIATTLVLSVWKGLGQSALAGLCKLMQTFVSLT
ncbi:hypothetical protein VNO77_33598 [Canavalia gladiata]|uniref:Uncharacterized protein n=1 Tax=Canavalia gladiata TaxID=3824 RepID=A0AAN9PXV4_CANGL